jgi:hypothetical protein
MDQSALLDLLEALKAAGVDERIRIAAQSMYQALIDAEAEGVIGAGFWERSEGRTAIRNGSRQRVLSTTAGDLELRIPKLRTGSFFPSLLERRRRINQALFAVNRPALLSRSEYSEGRRPGEGPGRGHRDLQVGGLPDLQGPR